MTDWQPIETAPKYGKNYVLLTGGEPDRMHWDDEPIPPMVVGYYNGGGWVMCLYDSDMATVYYDNPTHWMQLPVKPDVISKLSRFELRILKEVAGLAPSSSWGAAVSVCLSALYRNKYITSPFSGMLTDKGKEALGR